MATEKREEKNPASAVGQQTPTMWAKSTQVTWSQKQHLFVTPPLPPLSISGQKNPHMVRKHPPGSGGVGVVPYHVHDQCKYVTPRESILIISQHSTHRKEAGNSNILWIAFPNITGIH